MRVKSNGKVDALFCQIESNKHLLTENTYLLEKCAEIKIELKAIKYQHVQDGKIMDGFNKKLAEKDTEIARLKGEHERRVGVFKEIDKICNKTKIYPNFNATTFGRVKWVMEALQSTIKSSDDEIARLKGEYKNLIKAINPIANSREEALNTLKTQLIDYSQVFEDLEKANATIKSRDAEAEQLKKDVEMIAEASHKNAHDYYDSENKYRRLVDCLKKHWATNGKWLLSNHRANEKKLKEKRNG